MFKAISWPALVTIHPGSLQEQHCARSHYPKGSEHLTCRKWSTSRVLTSLGHKLPYLLPWLSLRDELGARGRNTCSSANMLFSCLNKELVLAWLFCQSSTHASAERQRKKVNAVKKNIIPRCLFSTGSGSHTPAAGVPHPGRANREGRRSPCRGPGICWCSCSCISSSYKGQPKKSTTPLLCCLGVLCAGGTGLSDHKGWGLA